MQLFTFYLQALNTLGGCLIVPVMTLGQSLLPEPVPPREHPLYLAPCIGQALTDENEDEEYEDDEEEEAVLLWVTL